MKKFNILMVWLSFLAISTSTCFAESTGILEINSQPTEAEQEAERKKLQKREEELKTALKNKLKFYDDSINCERHEGKTVTKDFYLDEEAASYIGLDSNHIQIVTKITNYYIFLHQCDADIVLTCGSYSGTRTGRLPISDISIPTLRGTYRVNFNYGAGPTFSGYYRP